MPVLTLTPALMYPGGLMTVGVPAAIGQAGVDFRTMSRTDAPPVLARLETQLVERFGHRATALLFIGLAMCLWPALELLGGTVIGTMHPLQLVWLRYGVHLLLLIVLVPAGGPHALVRTRHPGIQVARSLLMLGMPVFWLKAAGHMPHPTIMSVFWLAPFMAMLAAIPCLREWPTRRDVALSIAGYVTMLLILQPPAPVGRRGLFWGLLMAACYALYIVGARWLRREPTAVNLFHSALSVFVALTPVVVAVGTIPPVSAWAVIVGVGALGLLMLFLIDRATHLAPIGATAPMGYVQPVAESLTLAALIA